MKCPSCNKFAANEQQEPEVNLDATDDYQTKDRNGKPIKSARYMKHLYGFDVQFEVSCGCGQTSDDGQFSDSVPSSSMDELV